MQDQKVFKIYIINEDGEYYYLDSNGDVDTTTTPTEIEYNPKDWREMQIEWIRGFKYCGIFRNLTTPLKFVKDGAKILRWLYLNKGTEAFAQLKIYKFNSSVGVNDYELVYACDLDLSTYKHERRVVTCSATDNGNEAKLQSREGNDYDIPLDESPDYIWVKMHGINLQFRQTWIGADNEDADAGGGKINSFFQLSDEGTNLVFDLYDQYKTDTDWKILKNRTSAPITFTATFDYNYNLLMDSGAAYDGYFELQLWEFDEGTSLGTGVNQIFYSSTPLAAGSSATYVGSNTVTITLAAGHVLKVRSLVKYYVGPTEFTYATSDHEVTQLTGNKITVSIDNKMGEGYVKALRPLNLFTELAKKITDDTGLTVESTLLETHENKVILSGDGLRDLEKSVIRTNLDDLYTSLDAIFSTCMKYNKSTNTLSIESKQDAFLDTVGIDLGEVSELTYEPVTELIPSTIEGGYEAFVTDTVNGKDSFNIGTTWVTAMVKKATKKVMVSKLVADMYAIEFTRLNLEGKTITDSENDNKNYILHIEDTVGGTIPAGFRGEGEDYYNLQLISDPAYLQNIYSPATAFNYELTPKLNLLRNGAFIRALMYGKEDSPIVLTSSDKTNGTGTKLVYDDGSTYIDEGESILISTLPDPIFKPMYFRCRLKTPVNLKSVMDSNPYEAVTITYNGEDFKMHIYEAKTKLNLKTVQEFVLLPHKDTDLTTLIY